MLLEGLHQDMKVQWPAECTRTIQSSQQADFENATDTYNYVYSVMHLKILRNHHHHVAFRIAGSSPSTSPCVCAATWNNACKRRDQDPRQHCKGREWRFPQMGDPKIIGSKIHKWGYPQNGWFIRGKKKH